MKTGGIILVAPGLFLRAFEIRTGDELLQGWFSNGSGIFCEVTAAHKEERDDDSPPEWR